jgi:hypothetical protein
MVVMKETQIHLQWALSRLPRRRTGVSLHSHTLHSKESLDFIYRAARHSAILRQVLARGERRFLAHHGVAMDLRRGWWTPPLAPLDAQSVEAEQIESLDMAPMVSLTDHDDLEAPMTLQAVEPGCDVPLSTEWTVPFGGTFFHLGVHNLPARSARAVMHELKMFTSQPNDSRLRAILAWLHGMPGTLLVFNHPLWDEKSVGPSLHNTALERMLGTNRGVLHAVEMNGLRPWKENRLVLQLAREWELPVISGGDRHAMEPNANINLTDTATFGEFSDEVRAGYSEVLVMRHYRQAYATRILHNMVDALRRYDDHGLGWRRWEDRVFYQLPDGRVQSLADAWGDAAPRAVRWFETGVRTLGSPSLQRALRFASGEMERVSI